MAVLNVCGCSNPNCTCEYVFTTNGIGLAKEPYWEYHREITRDIAAGKNGRELQLAMKSPDSVYLSTAIEYSYCPQCDEMDFGGRIVVYFHKEGKKVELEYDDWNGSYHLVGFNSEEHYEEVLRIPTPCWRCGGELQYFDRYEDMKCPRCGSEMKNGESSWPRRKRTDADFFIDLWDDETPEEEDVEMNSGMEADESDQSDVVSKELIRQDGSRIVGYYDQRNNKGWTEEYDSQGVLMEKKYSNFWAKAILSGGDNDEIEHPEPVRVSLSETEDEALFDFPLEVTPEEWFEEGEEYFEVGSYHSALECFCYAAEQGHPEAAKRITMIYEEGLGGALCQERAREYFDKDNIAVINDRPKKQESPKRKMELFMRNNTVESIAAYHGVDPEDVRIGETPDGGVYTIIAEAGNYVSFTEYDTEHNEILHTSGYFVPREDIEETDEYI